MHITRPQHLNKIKIGRSVVYKHTQHGKGETYNFEINTFLGVYLEYVFKVVGDPCQKITLLLLKSKSVRVIVPESFF